MQLTRVLALLLLALVPGAYAHGATVHYELTVKRETVNLSGKQGVPFALTVNGGIPAPTLEFTEGDVAEIVVKNALPDEEVSVHWHGLLLPPEQDGVPYLNTPPILPGQAHTFRFPLRQHGTYWYHSHTMVQEQKGVYGAFIVHPRKATQKYDREAVAVISDWSDEDADQILKNLRKDGDYYLYKKNSVRSYAGALRAGGLGTMLKNEWQRMGGMDLSDVGYDAFLINGKRTSQLIDAKPGERLRLRLINAAASSYFYVSLGQAPFEVISADGRDIEPVLTREILMGMAETYDILFTVPAAKNYELRATAQDGTGLASAFVGRGEAVPVPDRPAPDLYAGMDHGAHGGAHAQHGDASEAHNAHGAHGAPAEHPAHGGDGDHGAHAGHAAHGGHPAPAVAKVVPQLTVDEIAAPTSSELPAAVPRHDVKLVLGGDMERYIWHINGKAIHQDQNLFVKEGEVVRFTFVNETMMHHPMHLHGHFFRVLNRFGARSPWKHTVDVPPHGTRVIEFLADEPGEWMLHCHNLYHMKTGMARVVKYLGWQPRPEIAQHQAHDPHRHEHLYWTGSVEAATNLGKANLRLSKTWDTLDLSLEARDEDRHWELEGDLFYRRWLSQYLNLIAGGTSYLDRQRATVGVGYTLPFLVESALLVDSKGDLRVDLHRRFQWTSRFFSDLEAKWRQHEGVEWEASLLYGPSWHWAAGLVVTDEKLGVGAQLRF